MGRNEPKLRISIDSSCFIGLLKGEETCQGIQHYLDLLDEDKCEIYLSPILIAEVFPAHKDYVDQHQCELLFELLRSSRVRYTDVTTALAEQARDLRMQHRIQVEDALILVDAIRVKAKYLFTTDVELLNVEVSGLKICIPEVFDSPTLFD